MADIDIDHLLDATLKDPNALDKVAVTPITKDTPSSDGRSDRKRSRERDIDREDDRKHSRRSRSPRRDRDRDYHDRDRRDRERDRGDRYDRGGGDRYDRDRRDNNRDRDGRRRSRSPRDRGGRSRRRSRSREYDPQRERRRREEERERQRQKEALLSPAERAAIEAERDARTVFAFNLPIRADERDLMSFFSKAGEVRDIRLIIDRFTRRSKGFGYIEYADKTMVLQAISLCSGTQLFGQTIQVQRSQVEKNRSASSMIAAAPEPSKERDDRNVKKDRLLTGNPDLDTDDSGFSVGHKSRLILMEKLKRDEPAPLPPPPPAPAQAGKCILMKNMFDPASETEPNWDQEMKQDVAEECSKFGTVEHVFVDKDSQGFIYMKFSSVSGAEKAIDSLDGRWFAGRMIEAGFFSESIYDDRFLSSR